MRCEGCGVLGCGLVAFEYVQSCLLLPLQPSIHPLLYLKSQRHAATADPTASPGSGEVSEAGLRALKAVMPVLEAGSEPASDSWEGLEGAATMRPGRLMSLRALHWAAMPAAILVWMQRTCPKVSLVRDAALEERPEPSLSVWELEDTRCKGRSRGGGRG